MTLIGIRVDGSHNIGLGHVYKSIWLAQTLRDVGCYPEFLTTDDINVRSLIKKEGFPVHWFPHSMPESTKVNILNQWVKKRCPSAVIIDHWDWPESYWNHLETSGKTIFAAIDSPNEGFHKFNLAFQGIRNSLKNLEFTKNGCAVYEGPRYIMAPPHYRHLAGGWDSSGKLEDILLTFGGTDLADFSLKILDRFEKFSGPYRLTLISGPGSLNHERAKGKAQRSRHQVRVINEVFNLPERMCQSDLAITTAGLGTISELALTKTPAILLAAVEHQVENANKFAPVGGIVNCAHKVGILDDLFNEQFEALAKNPAKLLTISNNWQGLVDAKGIQRIARIILERIQHGG